MLSSDLGGLSFFEDETGKYVVGADSVPKKLGLESLEIPLIGGHGFIYMKIKCEQYTQLKTGSWSGYSGASDKVNNASITGYIKNDNGQYANATVLASGAPNCVNRTFDISVFDLIQFYVTDSAYGNYNAYITNIVLNCID